MFIFFYTFGCKVNQYETELLRQNFESLGHLSVRNISDADVCVINTCTVTAQSEMKLKTLINRIRRENPAAIIALTGCAVQAFNEDLGCEVVCGISNKQLLPKLVERYVETRTKIVEIKRTETEYPSDEGLKTAGNKTRGIIKIQDGCDMFCSYCIIPYARGRSRSKPLENIKSEAKALSLAGQKEIVIVGINLCDYGKGSEYDLADAVKAVSEYAVRVRLGSLEPEKLTPEIIKKLSEIKNLCPHFHLALQSGCDKTLKEMRRKYVKSEYFTIVSELREAFPECAITTDIMVGFPGETDEDFNESFNTVKAINFADAHVFPYSPREGTPAAKRSDQITQNIKEKRAKIMSDAVKESAERYREKMIGTVQEVLFEREKSPDFHRGHSPNYQIVNVNHFTDTLFRQMKKVLITGVLGDELIGEIVKDSTCKDCT